MLEIKNVSKSYGRKVLNDVSLTLNRGQICGFFGVNGAGKSTLMKILCGLTSKDEGEILFDSRPLIQGKTPLIGAMIEAPSFFQNMTGYHNLSLLGSLIEGCTKESIIEALTRVGLYEKRNELVKNYSFGMKQRLYFASILMRDVDVLLLDEPFNGIDPIAQFTFEKILKELKKEGKIILISSHEIRELQAIVDRAIFIDKGKIIKEFDELEGVDIFNEFISVIKSSIEVQ